MAICPQTPERNAATQQKLRLEFSVLSDHANAYARSLRLVHELPDDLRDVYRGFGVDLPESNGEDSWTLPFPTRIVVDRTGLIRDVQSDSSTRAGGYGGDSEVSLDNLLSQGVEVEADQSTRISTSCSPTPRSRTASVNLGARNRGRTLFDTPQSSFGIPSQFLSKRRLSFLS